MKKAKKTEEKPEPPKSKGYVSPPLKDGQTRDDELLFCTGCFATNENSSWGGEVTPTYCMNCSGHGFVAKLTRCQIEDIRRTASWVGKRYYPHEEDYERYHEIELLRGQMPLNLHDRCSFLEAERQRDGTLSEARWNCMRFYPGGRNVSTTYSIQQAPTERIALMLFNKAMTYTDFVPDTPKRKEARPTPEYQAAIFLRHAANLLTKVEGRAELAESVGEASMLLAPKPHKLGEAQVVDGKEMFTCEACGATTDWPGMCPTLVKAL